MSVSKLALKAAVAASIAVMPAVAQASAASSLSLRSAAAADMRAGVAQTGESELGGGFLIPLLALGAVILGIVVALDDDDEDAVSP